MGAETSKRHGRPATVIPLRRALRKRLASATCGGPSPRQMHELRLLAELAKDRLEPGKESPTDAAVTIVAGLYEGRCWCQSEVDDIPPGHLHGCKWADENYEAGGF